ncbi:ATP-grasp domain-containing protein [Niveispirillum fermenti]|uniref:ATP-grasp domain-containing protein n=1 Tax=Niveispirillum fermenti TaxID=1233113 RepID=UPI003A8C21CF
MMLLEHDAKRLLADAGLPVPSGRLVRSTDIAGLASVPPALPLPLVVKAQVPVGGRGKAGGIRMVRDADALAHTLHAVGGLEIRGHKVRACRLEQAVDFTGEAYLSFTLDAGPGNVRLLMSARGGMDVEDPSMRPHLLSAAVPADPDSLMAGIDTLAPHLPDAARAPLMAAARALVPLFFRLEALLVEINPLFIRADGSWVAGDAKLAVDENAFVRQPELAAIVRDNPDLYPEAALKLEQGYDYVLLDPDGDIGLVTTGAGLSMQLVDELVARGRRPFNFCDIRTGQFRGDPARLIEVLERIAAGPSIRAVLINFFAGHTDLGEIARLLVIALKAVPHLKAPVTARMIGNGLDRARAIIREAGEPVRIETDLERAIALAINAAETAHA